MSEHCGYEGCSECEQAREIRELRAEVAALQLRLAEGNIGPHGCALCESNRQYVERMRAEVAALRNSQKHDWRAREFWRERATAAERELARRREVNAR